MRYDPTRRSLYFPESGEPSEDFSYRWPVEWICAELARLAYYRFDEGDGPRLERALTAAGFAAPEAFDVPSSGAQAFATLSPTGTAFVAFRGTQPGKLADLLADLRFGLVDWAGGGRVHSGFKEAYESISGDISAWLERSATKGVVATGHSLGGALATLLAAQRPEADLVTFGSPRVGDSAFAETFLRRHVRRYVDCTDKVTAVPPEILGYRHVGGEIYLNRFGLALAAPSAEEREEDQAAARKVYFRKYGWRFWRNVLARDAADHAPVNYVSGATGRRDPD
jgi:pimeloyl-ACP methyl ester carboxylesterase